MAKLLFLLPLVLSPLATARGAAEDAARAAAEEAREHARFLALLQEGRAYPRVIHDLALVPPGAPLVPPAAAELLDEVDEIALVRRFYDGYQAAARAAGHEVTLELSDFLVVEPRDYDRVRWLDLVDLGAGWRLRDVREEVVDERTGTGVVTYDLHWEHATPDLEGAIDEMRRAWQGLSVRAFFAAMPETTQHAEPLPHALVSYDVQLSFQGRTRTYRAVALVSVPHEPEPEMVTVNVEDWVVLGLERLFLEPRVLTPRDEAHDWPRRRMEPVTGALETAAAASGSQCVWNQYTEVPPHLAYVSGTEQHRNGKHGAQVAGEAICTHEANCVTYCRARIIEPSGCYEYGDLQFPCRHSVSSSRKAGFHSEHNASVSCGVALGCGVSACCSVCSGGVGFSTGGTAAHPEITANSTGSATVYDLGVTGSMTCVPPNEIPPPPPIPDDEDIPSDPSEPCECSPVLVDLDHGGFRLTGLEHPLAFDLDGDGVAEHLSWTAVGTGDAFLALDRNGNGTIDSGRELFGNFTEQPPSAEPNGYRALAVFDQPAGGGDGDGRITAADPVFARLRLWIDANRDGRSQPEELLALPAAGVEALHVEYVSARRRDRHGNEFRYSAQVELERGVTRSVDVFLLSTPSAP
ncbi:MAG TPA: hypothetical protein VHQ65_02620 [Thermoanaerobaculia bacterium]|nr:hypothetical protein [Thermoanaerobaculia bacterium]